MRSIEESAFADGIPAEALMEEAGLRIAEAVREFFPAPGHCIAVFGKGHNGGDALVAARYLQQAGWSIELRPAFPQDEWAPLTAKQHERLMPSPNDARSSRSTATIVLDGLLGIGAGGPLRGPIATACREINTLRTEANAYVFALDLPTGLNGDTGEVASDAVIADFTVTIGFAKTGLFFDGAINHVGRLIVAPLAELTKRAAIENDAGAITAATLRQFLPRRAFDTHKGQCGRIGVVAGSRGLIGAAVLCADAAVRGGGGLVTLWVPEEIYNIVAIKTAPEVMVRPVTSLLDALSERHDVLAIGPGLGRERGSDVLRLIREAQCPCVLDADALNLLATDLDCLDRCAGPRVLTPHPGEMARLDPQSSTVSRKETVEAFIQRWPHTLLLKGSRTIIGQRGRGISYNTTGNPGMATGGVGDVTTGLLAALIGQGLDGYHAAQAAAWLAGRAAECAIFHGGDSPETVRPTTILDHLGQAFRSLHQGSF